MATKSIQLEGIGEVVISKRRGQRSIRVNISGSKVKVTQPSWLPFSAGEAFAKDRRQWITEHIKPENVYVSGQKIANLYTLSFRRSDRKTVGSSIVDSNLIISLPVGIYPEDSAVQGFIQKKLHSILRDTAESYLPGRVAYLAETFGFNFKSVQVKLLKRRWGSCNSKKELTFNLNLMSLDTLHIDYVILHELTHTIHMNHGEKFWAHLESVFPNAKKVAKIVRRHDF